MRKTREMAQGACITLDSEEEGWRAKFKKDLMNNTIRSGLMEEMVMGWSGTKNGNITLLTKFVRTLLGKPALRGIVTGSFLCAVSFHIPSLGA